MKPQEKLDVAAVTEILRDHYEGTELFQSSAITGSPHESRLNTICNWDTQTSFVVQLRGNMPLDIGIVYWVCLASPCASFYIPFHFGIAQFPDGFYSGEETPSMESYQKKVESPFEADTLQAFFTFSNFGHKMNDSYGEKISSLQTELEEFKKQALTLQKSLEQKALKLYSLDKSKAWEGLTDYSNGLYLSAMEAMDRVLSERQ